MRKFQTSWIAPLVLAAPAFSAPQPAVAGHQTYIALGDSLAFGEYRFQDNPSNGDRGYVGPDLERRDALRLHVPEEVHEVAAVGLDRMVGQERVADPGHERLGRPVAAGHGEG